VTNWINIGWLKATRVGGRWRVSEDNLREFIERSTNNELGRVT